MSRTIKLRPETEEAIRQSNALLSEWTIAKEANKEYYARYHAACERLNAAQDALREDVTPAVLEEWQGAYDEMQPFYESRSPDDWKARDVWGEAREAAWKLLCDDAGFIFFPPLEES